MANYTYTDEFYRVSFITTSSVNIPRLLRQTGGLIIMSNTDGKECFVNPQHGVHNPKSIWFRGNHIASGYGAICEEERQDLTYLAGTYNALFKGIDDRFKDVSDTMFSYYVEFQNAMSYAYSEIDRVKTESYLYTDQQIEKLIGCAPTTLDTLGEIAHWLEHDKELGLDTVTHVKDISSSYVTHEEPDENDFVYLTYNGWKVVEKEEHDEHGHTYGANEDLHTPGSNQFTYSSFSVEPYGTIAMRDHQVATCFDNAELNRVLKCLVHPYPYTEPVVEMNSYQFTTVDKYPYAEVNETIDWNINYDYYVNDSKKIIAINNDVISNNVNYTYQTSGTHSIAGTYTVKLGDNLITNTLSYTFLESELQYYPQLTTDNIFIEDTDHMFEGATKTVDCKIGIVGYYKIFSNSGDSSVMQVPKTKTDITRGKFYWLDNEDRIVLDDIDVTEDIIWFALPTTYDATKFEVYLENIHTNIKQEVKPVLDYNGLNDSNILVFTLNNTVNYSNSVNYNIYQIINNKFNMGNQYNLVLEHLDRK